VLIIRRIVAPLSAAALGVVFAACSAESILFQPEVTADSVATLEVDEVGNNGAFMVLRLPTYDGYNQTVHPDYAMMPDWSPRRFLVATPYAFGDSTLENPSLFSQNANFEWSPHGLANPIARPRVGHLSDPDIVAVPERNELWVYYREATRRNTIWLVRSGDGISWTDPDRVVSAPRHMIVSPSVVRRAAEDWLMWSVNAGKEGCTGTTAFIELRRSSDGLHWSPPERVSLSQAPFSPWHIEVQWIPSREEYWAVYNAKRVGNCNTDLLFLATSPDGLTWTTYPSPLLRAGAIPEFNEIVYRSTFAYNPKTDKIRFWFSGARWNERGFVWSTAYQKRRRTDVFEAIAREPIDRLTRRRGHDAPLLVNPP
jgi:hypothetical protein